MNIHCQMVVWCGGSRLIAEHSLVDNEHKAQVWLKHQQQLGVQILSGGKHEHHIAAQLQMFGA